MTILPDYPPNIRQILRRFPDVGGMKAVFTYGGTLYNPKRAAIDHPLMVHEETHARQQSEVGVEEWWKRYLWESEFRLDQEVEAYRNQYRAMNRQQKRASLNKLASDLSGPMYGRIVEYDRAKELISGESTRKRTR